MRPDMASSNRDRVPIEPQSVDAPLSRAAVFLVATIAPGEHAMAHAREVISDIGGLVRTVGFRDLNGHLSCNVGIGSTAWDRLGRERQPSQLHAFSEVRGPTHTAVSTPGDPLFHIPAQRTELCFVLEKLILEALGDPISVVDERQGLSYVGDPNPLGV